LGALFREVRVAADPRTDPHSCLFFDGFAKLIVRCAPPGALGATRERVGTRCQSAYRPNQIRMRFLEQSPILRVISVEQRTGRRWINRVSWGTSLVFIRGSSQMSFQSLHAFHAKAPYRAVLKFCYKWSLRRNTATGGPSLVHGLAHTRKRPHGHGGLVGVVYDDGGTRRNFDETHLSFATARGPFASQTVAVGCMHFRPSRLSRNSIPLVLGIRSRAPMAAQKFHDPLCSVDRQDARQWRFEANVLGHIGRDRAPPKYSCRCGSVRSLPARPATCHRQVGNFDPITSGGV
jgi:hypothetical protein